MSTETISIADLEEHLSLDVPCGGNTFPLKRACPNSAVAILVKFRCCNADGPEAFKCLKCYVEWRAYDNGNDLGRCPRCYHTMPLDDWYSPL